MKVKELMTRDVRTCSPEDRLNRPAQLMWEGDCGVVPVIGKQGQVVGMITDRDLCMAAYTKGQPLASLTVGDTMSKEVSSCSPEATLETAMSMMKEARVRRLPVADSSGKLVGIVSLNDLACESRRQGKSGGRQLASAEVADTLGVICEHRGLRYAAAEVPRAGSLVGAGA